ncbi:hypothetical protein R1flu_021753 [Riccia fluitans]|uniref:Malectin-like domain-containing protein n=1 Tax=Riccia fluitans TaxID=41844 RepID=A0ABD1ZQ95_9MARC
MADILSWTLMRLQILQIAHPVSSSSLANPNAQGTMPLFSNHPPPVVFQTAWNASNITFRWPVSFLPKGPRDTQTYYVALYFVDITGRNSRVLNAYPDGVALNRIGDNDANSSFPLRSTVWRLAGCKLDGIEAIKTQFNLSQWQGDPCLAWPYDWLRCSEVETSGSTSIEIVSLTLSTFNLTGTIPTVIADLFELNDLSLDNNNFSETIPDLSGLTKLQSLLLQNNKLSGKIPEFLVSLPLTLLKLDINLFEGEVPRSIQRRLTPGANNNPSLCFGENKCQQPPAPSPQRNSDKKSSRTGAVIGGAAGGVVLLLLILLLVYWKFLRKPDPKIVQGVAHEGGGSGR